ncbi:MAG: internalization-related competence protein ComEC/Rec2 [Steroidobacteraceae bacterium]|jgi:competence protein ComEC|nr:internalization-related competence protein ComEC/Rec2 [Steroidobacteraceae bacterium]
MVLAGQLLAFAQSYDWQKRRLPEGGSDTRVLAEGRVATIPAREGASLRFDLAADSIEGLPATHSGSILRVEWRDPHASPRVGERWRLLMRLRPLEETRNFSGFDGGRLAFRQGVHGAGRVLPSAMNDVLELAPASLDTLRARIGSRIRESIADPDAAALVTALSVGLTAGMTRDQWRVFNATGTTHLVAISGLHVTLFAWLMFRGARFLWRRLPALHAVAREPFALLSGLAAAGGYSLLAGLSVPTQRTWLMLALYVAARLTARHVDAGRLWSLALVLVLLTDVRAPLAAGFWLSFIAVGVLLALADRWSAWRVQFAVTLALMPASVAIFSGVSLVGLAVNLIAIPVISLVFVPLVLFGTLVAWWAPALDAPVFDLAARLYEWLWPGLAWCADLDGGAIDAFWRVSPPAWWFLAAAPASLVWLCRWPWALRLTAICVLLPLLLPLPDGPVPRSARIEVLDAGNGSAVLVRTRSHLLLFDTGDSWNTRGSRIRQVVMPALDSGSLRRVDVLLMPALNGDRARGAVLLAMERGVGEMSVGGGWPGSGLASRCRNASWHWDGVEFVSHAVGRYCLLRISVGEAAVTLSGDLDAAAERALLARASMASELVVIGRQGSETASSREWIENTAPGLAIAAGGIDGAQSRRRVLERWRHRGGRILDTHVDGAVVLGLTARGIEIQATARASRFPFHWRRPV